MEYSSVDHDAYSISASTLAADWGGRGAFAPPSSQLGGHCPPYFAAQYI